MMLCHAGQETTLLLRSPPGSREELAGSRRTMPCAARPADQPSGCDGLHRRPLVPPPPRPHLHQAARAAPPDRRRRALPPGPPAPPPPPPFPPPPLTPP